MSTKFIFTHRNPVGMGYQEHEIAPDAVYIEASFYQGYGRSSFMKELKQVPVTEENTKLVEEAYNIWVRNYWMSMLHEQTHSDHEAKYYFLSVMQKWLDKWSNGSGDYRANSGVLPELTEKLWDDKRKEVYEDMMKDKRFVKFYVNEFRFSGQSIFKNYYQYTYDSLCTGESTNHPLFQYFRAKPEDKSKQFYYGMSKYVKREKYELAILLRKTKRARECILSGNYEILPYLDVIRINMSNTNNDIYDAYEVVLKWKFGILD